MATLYSQADSNIRKTMFLMLVFFFVVTGIGWAFSYVLNAPEILWIAVLFAVGMNVGSYWFSDKIVLSMTGARPVTHQEYPDLWNIVENLTIAAGLPMPKLYIIDDPAPNAFATGRDPKHAVVAVTSGLMKILDRSELEGVIAHELSHIKNRDMLVMTVVVVLVGFVTLLSDFFLRASLHGGNSREGGGQARIVMIVVGFLLAIFAPLIAQLIQLAISRKREYLADASGALLTRYPEGLASALQKISGHVGAMKSANHATAHLFISDPFDREDQKTWSKWITQLFMTHPPTEDRVRALLGKK
jgi:heat shock protein HtpX